MVTAKTAVENSLAFATSLLGDLAGLRLEEVELSDDGHHWIITLSFVRPTAGVPVTSQGRLASLIPDSVEREYKTFRIDVSDGAVQSMKIRDHG